MSKQKIGLLVASAIGMAATFLPWAKVGPMSINGSVGDGWLTFGLFVISLIVALLAGRKTGQLSTGALIGGTVPAILALGLGALKVVQVGDAGGGLASPGIGLFVVIGAGVLYPVLGFALKGPAAPAA
jgi:hypothetical protein